MRTILPEKCFPAACWLIVVSVNCLLTIPEAPGQSSTQQQLESRTYDRYLKLLQRQPKRGAAFDKVYAYHVDAGTLDDFLTALADDSRRPEADGSAALILGLVEMRRGRDSAAASAFRVATQQQSDSPIAMWYLGQAMMAAGQTSAAADALEQAIVRKPTRADLAEIYELLGRVYQRAHRHKDALELWTRFEAEFPDDHLIRQQIAAALLDEGDATAALPRYEQLAQAAADPFQRIDYAIIAADLKLKLGRRDAAIADFETVLQQLKPGSWQFQDVRRRIENAFLQDQSSEALVEYYQKWLEQNPDDLAAMEAVSRQLAAVGQHAKAREWLHKAIQKAPTDVDLRESLIRQLLVEDDVVAALGQYEQLAKLRPDDVEILERWGQLWLRNQAVSEAKRKARAAEVWERLLATTNHHPARISRMAELFRSAGLSKPAIALYRWAIAEAPQAPEYREYLGEYLHEQQRPNEAKQVWAEIADGDRRTTANCVRLSEVLQGFGYINDAVQAMREACELQPGVTEYVRLATLLRDQQQYDDALQQLQVAATAAATAEERTQVQNETIQTYLASGRLNDQIRELQQQITLAGSDTADQRQQLALYQEAAGQLQEASRSIREVLQQKPESVQAWSLAARIQEKAGLLADAAAAHTRLAQMDPRERMSHLQQVSTLQQQLGLGDEALQAAENVLAAAPDNPEAYRFFADICFQLGKSDRAIDALRQSVRANPGDIDTLLMLAQTLADRFRTDEAIDLYWRAFARTESTDQRTTMIRRLTGLYLRTNRFDRLLTRLDTLAQTASDRRAILQCKADALQGAGDWVGARQTLEELLNQHPGDARLLKELSAVADQAQDLPAAVEFQQRLVTSTNSDEASARLAELLLRSGKTAEAAGVWRTLSANDVAISTLLPAIDQMMKAQQLTTARSLLERLTRVHGEDPSVQFRLAVIAWKQENYDAAMAICDALLKSSIPQPLEKDQRSPLHRTDVARHVLYDLGLIVSLPENLQEGRSGGVPWQTERTADLRTGAIALKIFHAKALGELQTRLQEMWATATVTSPDALIWDVYDAVTVTDQWSEWSPELAPRLAAIPHPHAQMALIDILLRKAGPPLDATQAQQLVSAYQQVRRQHVMWIDAVGGIPRIIDELHRCDQDVLANQLRHSLTTSDAWPTELRAAFRLALKDGDVGTVLDVVDRVILAERNSASAAAANDTTLDTLGWTFSELASRKASEQDFAAVADLIRRFLQIKTDAAAVDVAARTVPEIVDNVVTSSHRMFKAGQQSNSLRVTTLPENRHWSSRDITFLVNLQALFGGDRWSQLLDIVREFSVTAAQTARHEHDAAVITELALAHLFTMHGDQDQGAVHLVRAAAAEPADAVLRLTLVRYYRKAGNLTEALALLDTIDAVDHNVMRQKELLALELAAMTGNPARARSAAERLFGLRLDTATSLKLIAQMQTLGLNELADALLNRTRKTSGNEIGTLVSLMQQYSERGNLDVAGQIAHQILTQTNTGTRRSAAAEAARETAVEMLADAGQLEAVIRRTEEQLRTSQSSELMRSLVEFYKAAGRDADALDMASRLSEQQPESIDNLLRLAGQYEKSRNPSAACDRYLQVLARDPQRFTQNYYQYLRTFQNAGRLPDLADVLLAVDIRKLHNNYYVISETIEYLFHEVTAGNDADHQNRDKGLALLAAAWKAFPNDRSYLLNNVRDPRIWNRPEMFQYAKEGLMPSTVQQAIARPWQGVADSPTFTARGDIIGTLTRVLRAMPDQERLLEFTAQVEDGVRSFEHWHGGRLILSVLKARAHDDKTALALLQKVRDDAGADGVPVNAAWLVGAELEKQSDAYLPAVTDMLQQSLTQNAMNSKQGYLLSPGRRLALLQARSGRRDAARMTVWQTIEHQDAAGRGGMEPGEQAEQQLADYSDAAATLVDLKFPFDAIAMYHRITRDLLTESTRELNDGASHRRYREARQAEATLLRSATAESLIEFLQRPGGSEAAGIDLILTAPEPDSQIDFGNSAILLALHRLASNEAAADRISTVLRDRLQSQAPDLSTAVAAFVFADAAQRLELKTLAMQPLLAETVPSSDQLFTRQAVAVWIVARQLLSPSARPTADEQRQGAQLADFAEAAAVQLGQSEWLQAMLKERGQLAIESNNLPAAEQAWSRLLDVVLPVASSGNPDTGEPAASQPSASAVQELRQRLLIPGAVQR